jgi:hypothetical protein
MIHLRRSTRRRQSGMVTVEFALTAPILFLLFMGAIEFSRANMLMHTTTIAATEGARRGIVSGATAADIVQAVQDELSAVGIAASEVAIDPAVITPETEVVAVGVGVPINSANGYFIPRFFLGSSVIKSASMTREAMPSDAGASQSAAARARAASDVIEALGQGGGGGG